jgi:DNA modification methylase
MTTIYNADCIEVMKQMPDKSVDMVLTDPPYILTPHGGGKQKLASRSTKVRDEIDFIANDFDYESTFGEFIRLCKVPNIVLFCSNLQLGRTITYFENKGLKVDVLVWSKTNPAPLCNGKYISDLEYIVYVHDKGSYFNNDAPLEYKKKTKRYSIITNKMGKVHPTQKPVELMNEFIEVHTKQGDVVLDSFMGGGSTGMACIKAKRNFIGIEIDKGYFDVAKKRIEEAEREQKESMALFEEVV